MKSIILLFLTLNAFAQFTNETTKKIDKIQNNTASDITIDPSNDLIISSGVANRVPYFDSSKKLLSSGVTDTELGYLSGVTSGLQSQINGKEPTINLTPNRAVTSDGAGGLSVSATTDTELGFLSGVTSSVQTQINAKLTSPLTTDGDLMIYNTTEQRLPIGSTNQILTVIGGFPSWQDAPVSTTLNTKGQLQGFSTVNANVGPCTDDQILVYDTLEATGWKCSDPPSTSPTTTEGDLIVRGATEDERLPIGAVDYLLTSNGTTASWQPAPVSTTLTTKGDLQTFDTANARLPVGNDNEILFADSTTSTGLAWKDPATVVFSVAQSEFVFDVNIGGNNISTGGVSTTYTEVIDSAIDMVINKGSNIEIPCSGTNPSTGLTCSAGAEVVGVVFDAQVGHYEICTNFTHFTPAATVDSFATYQLIETPNNAQTFLQLGNQRIQVGSNAPAGNDVHLFPTTICGNFEFTTAGQKTIRLMKEKPNSTASTIFGDRATTVGQRDINITGKYYPPQSQIVRQNRDNWFVDVNIGGGNPVMSTGNVPNYTELINSSMDMVKRSGSADAEIPCSSTNPSTGLTCSAGSEGVGVVFTPPRPDYYDVCIYASDARFHANYSNYGVYQLHETPNNAQTILQSGGTKISTAVGDQQSGVNYNNISHCSTFKFNDTNEKTIRLMYEQVVSGIPTTNPIILADRNANLGDRDIRITVRPSLKSGVIVGEFEQIKSTELCQVEAYGNDGESITLNTEDIPWKTEIKDNCNAWSNAGNTGNDTNDAFTAPRSARYSISGSLLAGALVNGIRIHEDDNSTPIKVCGVNEGNTSIVSFSCEVDMVKDSVYTLRFGSLTNTLSNSNSIYNHRISISELPDIASIVKNLNQNNNVVCSTKYLSATASSTGVMSDLTFSNLAIGKKYKFDANFLIIETAQVGVNAFREWYVRALNGATTLGNTRLRMDVQTYVRESRSLFNQFTATDTSLTFNQILATNSGTEGGSPSASYVTLCELPDNYLEGSF